MTYLSVSVSWERGNLRVMSRELYIQYKSEHWKVLWATDIFRWSEEVFVYLQFYGVYCWL